MTDDEDTTAGRKGKPEKAEEPDQFLTQTMDAFTRLTGAHPVGALDAWEVFYEAVLAVVHPTPESAKVIAACARCVRATGGTLKARLFNEFQHGHGDHWRKQTPHQVRSRLFVFDLLFANLTDEQVQNAFTRRGPAVALASLCFAVGAMGSGHATSSGIKKLAANFRQAEQRHGAMGDSPP